MTASWPAAAALFAQERPLVWLFTGDSVTQGARHTFGWRDYTELFAERVRLELGRSRDAVINTAVSGRRVADLAADVEWSVLRHRPDVVVLMFGLNDCVRDTDGVSGFRQRLSGVADRVRSEAGAEVLLQTPNLPGPGDPERQKALPAYVDAIREVAAGRGIPLVDHVPVWEDAAGRGVLEHWTGHGCHPNEYGHRAIARRLIGELGLGSPPSAVLDLFVP